MLAGRIDAGSGFGETRSKLRNFEAWNTPGRAHRENAFQTEVRALAQVLATDSTEDSAEGINLALDLLISGLGASVAAFYTSRPRSLASADTPAETGTKAGAKTSQMTFSRQSFRSIRGMAAGAGGLGGHAAFQSCLQDTLDLARLPDRGEALRAGEARRVFWPQAIVRPQLRGAAGSAQWQSVSPLSHALLLIPCLGPEGLLGLFAVDGGLASRRGTQSILTHAALLGTQVASLIERKRLEAELASLRKLRADGDRLETLGRVATSVAHDFNNVLTAIGGNAELLEIALPEDAKEHIEVREIVEATQRAADLVEEVLSFGRRRKSGARRVNLAELIARLTPITRRVAGGRMDVEVELPPDLPSIELNPARFERVLLNLASNARDAQPVQRPSAGSLSLSVRNVRLGDSRSRELEEVSLPDGEYVCLCVEDDGCGMDNEVRKKAFEPFFTTKGEGRGTGLGLATCAEVMGELGGAVVVDSAPGEGTRFDLYFPVAP